VQLPDEIDAASGSEVWVAENDHCIGHIVLRDQPRAEALEALSGVRAAGIDRIILLTGDRASVAREVGDALGVDDVVAEVLPEQKLEVVRAQQTAGRIVMMVGDGVNDAPALAGADLGIVIGAELNEIALGGADVALLGNDLRRVSQLVRLAEATRGILAQNVWLAFGFSGVLIALAAAGTLQPITGAVAQSLAVVAVVLNSARILRVPLEAPPVVVEPLESLPPDPPPTLATEPVAEAIVETATSPEHDD
jgi:cation-transporting P-type ATPase C